MFQGGDACSGIFGWRRYLHKYQQYLKEKILNLCSYQTTGRHSPAPAMLACAVSEFAVSSSWSSLAHPSPSPFSPGPIHLSGPGKSVTSSLAFSQTLLGTRDCSFPWSLAARVYPTIITQTWYVMLYSSYVSCFLASLHLHPQRWQAVDHWPSGRHRDHTPASPLTHKKINDYKVGENWPDFDPSPLGRWNRLWHSSRNLLWFCHSQQISSFWDSAAPPQRLSPQSPPGCLDQDQEEDKRTLGTSLLLPKARSHSLHATWIPDGDLIVGVTTAGLL